jgi:hypothetical protein
MAPAGVEIVHTPSAAAGMTMDSSQPEAAGTPEASIAGKDPLASPPVAGGCSPWGCIHQSG